MSGGLAPSKSTVYVSNLPFSLTNNDLHKVFEKYGKVVKVTIVKDNKTHKSKGVAFVLFLEREVAYQCVKNMNRTEMFGRTIKCSIAKDNGRASEFIRRKEYKDKSKCYECGEEGHMSYKCPKNLLGAREPPPKKKKKGKDYSDSSSDEEGATAYGMDSRKRKVAGEEGQEEGEDSDHTEDPTLESLASAVRYEQYKKDEEDYRFRVAVGDYKLSSEAGTSSKKKYKKDAYFSDEEELEDD